MAYRLLDHLQHLLLTQLGLLEKQTNIKLKACNPIHFVVHGFTWFWEMCIAIGKYTVRGQNAEAPRRPKMSLKKGNNIDTSVVKTTNVVLHINLNKLISNAPIIEMCITYSLCTNRLFGHDFLVQFSTNANTGWVNTCE